MEVVRIKEEGGMVFRITARVSIVGGTTLYGYNVEQRCITDTEWRGYGNKGVTVEDINTVYRELYLKLSPPYIK